MPTPITVNLNVNVNADGNIEVFGYDKGEYTNTIVATPELLPVNALYDETKNGTKGAGLIEFWEPSADLGNIYVKLADSSNFNINGAASYEGSSKLLACGIQKVLVNKLDCTNITPFNDDRYGGVNADYYRKIDGFGRVALGIYSHYLFGHVAATAAITNDEAFMAKMLSLPSDTPSVKVDATADARYAAWAAKKAIVDNGLVSSWGADQSADDANLSIALVKKLIAKSVTAPLSATRNTPHRQANDATVKFGPDTLANIVAQVIGQDATRAMGQDNNALEPEVHHILRFYPKDKIVVRITLDSPNVYVTGSAAAQAGQQGEPAQSDYDKQDTTAGIQKEVYDIEIEMGERSAEYDAPL